MAENVWTIDLQVSQQTVTGVYSKRPIGKCSYGGSVVVVVMKVVDVVVVVVVGVVVVDSSSLCS